MTPKYVIMILALQEHLRFLTTSSSIAPPGFVMCTFCFSF